MYKRFRLAKYLDVRLQGQHCQIACIRVTNDYSDNWLQSTISLDVLPRFDVQAERPKYRIQLQLIDSDPLYYVPM